MEKTTSPSALSPSVCPISHNAVHDECMQAVREAVVDSNLHSPRFDDVVEAFLRAQDAEA